MDIYVHILYTVNNNIGEKHTYIQSSTAPQVGLPAADNAVDSIKVFYFQKLSSSVFVHEVCSRASGLRKRNRTLFAIVVNPLF